MMLPDGVPTDVMKLLDFSYLGEEKRQTINFLDPLSLPNEAIRLFERLFQIKKKVIHHFCVMTRRYNLYHLKYKVQRVSQRHKIPGGTYSIQKDPSHFIF